MAAFSGISASCGNVERAAPNQPESGEEQDAGKDVVSALDASADAENDGSRTDSMTADAPLCEAIPAPAFDAGDPPSDCIPPCIWNAIKNCFPKGPSAQENAWCRECTREVGGIRCDHLVDGVSCYGSSGSRLGIVWSNGESQVAWAARNEGSLGKMTVHCCAGSEGFAICDAGAEVYDVDLNAEHCAFWRELL